MGLGATDAQIDQAASRLGVVFGSDLAEYLSTMGQVSIDHREVFGLGPEVPAYLDLELVTLAERRGYGVPDKWVVVYNNGAGDLTCVNDDGSVVTLWHEDQSVEVIASGFWPVGSGGIGTFNAPGA